jgi:TPP-dependent pyruvate/acetoin dehydrogenase alpha subunit
VEYARKHGPVLIESMTYRYKGHGVSDRSYDKRLVDESGMDRQQRPDQYPAQDSDSK